MSERLARKSNVIPIESGRRFVEDALVRSQRELNAVSNRLNELHIKINARKFSLVRNKSNLEKITPRSEGNILSMFRKGERSLETERRRLELELASFEEEEKKLMARYHEMADGHARLRGKMGHVDTIEEGRQALDRSA